MYHWDKPADPAPARRRKLSPDSSAARLPAPRDGSDPTGSDPTGSDPTGSDPAAQVTQGAQAAQAAQGTQTSQAVQTNQTSQPTQATQATQAGPPTQATQAVQFALDRRDNGGDALTAAGRPTARQTRQ
jgi:hypothetical protein